MSIRVAHVSMIEILIFLCQGREYIRVQLQPLIANKTQHIASPHATTTISPPRQVNIISALAGVWELEIARIFCTEAALQPFHAVFLSCNEPIVRGGEESSSKCEWCLKCEKCCFLYLLMSAWLSPEDVIHNIFRAGNSSHCNNINHIHKGIAPSCALSTDDDCHSLSISVNNTTSNNSNGKRSSTTTANSSINNNREVRLFEDMSLLPVFQRLIGGGKNAMKPFECVGTFIEASAAVELALCRHIKLFQQSQKKEQHQAIEGKVENNDIGIKVKDYISNENNNLSSSQSELYIPPVLQALCEYLHIPILPPEAVTLSFNNIENECENVIVSRILTKWGLHK